MRLLISLTTVFWTAVSFAAFDHEHVDFTQALSAIVVYKDNTAEVNYAALQRKPNSLIKYLKGIGKVTEKAFKEFSADEQKAFLINSYNAFTLQLLKDNFPVPSIQKIEAPGGAFKIKFIRLFGREYNLNELKARIRKEFPDIRLNFALTSASVGGPRLRNEAYVGVRLNDQLEDQLKVFLRDTGANRLDTTKKVAQVSSVFNDLQEDFTKTGTTVTKFIAPYISDDANVRTELEGGAYTVEYLDQNWNLNKLAK